MLQALYETDTVHHEPVTVIDNRLMDEPVDEETERFARRLFSHVIDHKDMLDAIIRQYAPEWPLEQVSIVDRNILRIALCELRVTQDAPVKVVINEAVEPKAFGSDSSPRFVNGVLGSAIDTGGSRRPVRAPKGQPR
ncbi:MAG: transcription antitermination factor NusB [Anaerolineae bacterium]|nr:MAG: transcription antitermination factor NusB [Anaerolineae bacterium]